MRRIKMTTFKMRNRPKKPIEPRTISFEVGCMVTLGYFQECVEKFKTENPDRSEREIMVVIEDTDWGHNNSIHLSAPPESQRDYETKKEEYKLELKAYKMWQGAHEKEIDIHKVKQKKRAARTKLLRSQERLNKELAKVQAKLEK
jgi:hypothetical protein